jgi:outer membrane protein assembly factor BamB
MGGSAPTWPNHFRCTVRVIVLVIVFGYLPGLSGLREARAADGGFVQAAAGVVCEANRTLRCYDDRTLDLLWHRETSQGGMLTPGGSVMILAVASTAEAIDPRTGAELWSIRRKGRLFPAVVARELVLLSSVAGELIAVDRRNGDIVWSRSFEGWVYPPAVVGEVAVVSGRDRRLRGLRLGSGATVWAMDLDQEPVGGPVRPAGESAIVATTFAGTVLKVSASDGNILWKTSLDTPALPALLSGFTLVFPLIGGDVTALASADGRPVWRLRGLRADLLAADAGLGLVHAVSAGSWTTIDAASGQPVRRIPLNHFPAAVHPGSDGGLLLKSGDGIVYLLDASGYAKQKETSP